MRHERRSKADTVVVVVAAFGLAGLGGVLGLAVGLFAYVWFFHEPHDAFAGADPWVYGGAAVGVIVGLLAAAGLVRMGLRSKRGPGADPAS